MRRFPFVGRTHPSKSSTDGVSYSFGVFCRIFHDGTTAKRWLSVWMASPRVLPHLPALEPIHSQYSVLYASNSRATAPFSVRRHLVAHYLKQQMRSHRSAPAIFLPPDMGPNPSPQPLSISFSQLRKTVDALAQYFLDVGVRPSDRVLAVLPSGPESTFVQFACARIGAVCAVAPLAHEVLSSEALRGLLDMFQPRHLVAREWLYGAEKKSGSKARWSFHSVLLQLVPELNLRYPGQLLQRPMCHEFPDLTKVLYLDPTIEPPPPVSPKQAPPRGPTLQPVGAPAMRELSLTKRPVTWGPRSYHESRLRRFEFLLHPEDPILALPNPHRSLEDKAYMVYSHRSCLNAGALFAHVMGLSESNKARIAALPGHHMDPIGAIIAPFACLMSGASHVHLHEDPFSMHGAREAVIQAMVDQGVSGVLGTINDMEQLRPDVANARRGNSPAPTNLNPSSSAQKQGTTENRRVRQEAVTSSSRQVKEDSSTAGMAPIASQSLQWIALFEDASQPSTWCSPDQLRRIQEAFGVREVFLFRGTMEACWMLTWRGADSGESSVLPHCSIKVVGDRGTSDAKILLEGTRGNLRYRGAHVTPLFHNNVGVVTEFVDSEGWIATSRDGIVTSTAKSMWQALAPQMY